MMTPLLGIRAGAGAVLGLLLVTACGSHGAVPPPPASFPADFVGVENGRIGLYDSRSGNLLRYLTQPTGGQADYEPVVTDSHNTAYFVRGATASHSQYPPGNSEIWRVHVDSGRAEPVVAAGPAPRWRIAVSRDGRMLAWTQGPGPESLHTRDLTTGVEKTFRQGNPPAVDGKPSWAQDDRHLAYIYRGGGGVAHKTIVVDTATAQGAGDGAPLGGAYCNQELPIFDGTGGLLVITCPNDSSRASRAAVRFDPGTGEPVRVLFSVPDGGLCCFGAFSAATGGRAVLLELIYSSGGRRAVYRWSDGSLVQLTTPATEPAW